ncbi:hypothetical protein ACJIZ3_005069 [Penstemon smallii]|uniref:Uncharacterized protein n=1 Tax=Penstemon smallii TaxID=265156 RepID=A0ABD3S3V9_9LAMI
MDQNFDEQRWIIHIQRTLDEDLEEQSDEIPVSIFNIPKTLMLHSPDSYIPQQVALGPYHHWRPELYEMERYKLSSAKRFRKQIQKEQSLKLQNLVDHLTKSEPMFRACYHKYINLNGETIAWMMAVDSSFLLEFLQIFVKESKISSADNGIIKDILMLENQIPLFSLTKMLEFQLGSLDEAKNTLYAMLMTFCKEILPFKMTQELNNVHEVMSCAHLLDLLYLLIIPKSERSTQTMLEAEEQETEKFEENNFLKIISNLRKAPVSLTKRILISKPVQFMLTLPCKIISNLPGVILVKQFEYFCFSQEKETTENGNNINQPPFMEEIEIPSVIELLRAGINFSAINEGIFSIKFDEKMATFYLPTIILHLSTEVALRNLVAYESCSESGPLIFTRYIELMNGIIDTKEDAKFLREKGIVLNHLKSDEDVANLWNGMSRSIRLTKVPFLDKVIEEVNNYYNGRWKVRIGKFMAQHVFGSWQSLTLMAVITLLFLMSLQVFCSMFSCGRLFQHHHTRMN